MTLCQWTVVSTQLTNQEFDNHVKTMIFRVQSTRLEKRKQYNIFSPLSLCILPMHSRFSVIFGFSRLIFVKGLSQTYFFWVRLQGRKGGVCLVTRDLLGAIFCGSTPLMAKLCLETPFYVRIQPHPAPLSSFLNNFFVIAQNKTGLAVP